MFTNKTLLITGGTGSFGNAVLKRFIDTDLKEIRIFSRDEKKQDDMRHLFQTDKLKFYLGDVRDKDSVDRAMKNVDYVFSAAALKQVPSCEFFPIEAVKTNILGTSNVIESAIEYGVSKVIILSTDKACYPINAMGISKALMEKVAIARGRSLSSENDNRTTICCTRYGNVMCSRGSVIPLWVEQIKNNTPITMTDPNMTRFMMTLDDAVDLVLYAFQHGNNGDLFIQKSPACSLDTLSKSLQILFDGKNSIKIIGTRHGEKLYESLLTREEMFKSIDLGNFYKVPCDDRTLNYDDCVTIGNEINGDVKEYSSSSTEQFGVDQMIDLLKKVEYIQQELENRK